VLAITRTMNDRNNDNFVAIFFYFIDNDVGPLDQLARTLNKAGPTHVRQFRNGKLHHFIFDAFDQLERSTRIVFGNLRKNSIELLACGGLEAYLHVLEERNCLKTSSAGILFEAGLAKRRRTSAACSAVSRRVLLSCSSMSSTMWATSAWRAGGQLKTRSRIALTCSFVTT
jgi:hypothetical protein